MITMGELVNFRRQQTPAVPVAAPEDVPRDGSSMRSLVTRQCSHCAHCWIQPKDGGKCPACGSRNVQTVAVRNNELKRL